MHEGDSTRSATMRPEPTRQGHICRLVPGQLHRRRVKANLGPATRATLDLPARAAGFHPQSGARYGLGLLNWAAPQP
jgi:hypothetical protein